MNVTATTASSNVVDVPAAGRFFTTHLGFRELVVAEGIVCLGRDDAAADLVLPGAALLVLIVMRSRPTRAPLPGHHQTPAPVLATSR